MSSHHIVREKQEPALYIHDLGSFDEESLGQLLEWSPTLIVNSNQYEKIVSLGLKVDFLVASGAQGMPVQENTRIIDAGEQILDSVLDFLLAENYSAVNIIAVDTGIKLRELGTYIAELSIVIFEKGMKTYAIRSGFNVWKPQGTVYYIEVLSYFETSNLKQIEDGSFVVINDGFVSFLFTAPFLFITEQL